MKKIKKLMALVIALAMVLGMGSMTALAAKVSMEIPDNDTHEYKVYQIYTGDLSTDGKTLSNVKYGNSGYGTEGEAVPAEELEGITNADTFARSIAGTVTTSCGTLKAENSSLDNLEAGYYLIVDDTAKALNEGDAYSAYIVEILNTVEINPKKDTTTVDKKISTDTLGEDDSTTEINGKTDNVSIGDTVNYEITGTVPSHATDYNYYFYIIEDSLTSGLTFKEDTLAVKAGDAVLTKDVDYKLYTGENVPEGKTFQVALIDAKAQAGKTITVTYSAELNSAALIGELSNDNTVTIQYSNNPNHDYDGDKDNDNPGKPASGKDTPLGTTPESKTTTFTTGIQIQKVDQNGKVLTGAEFTLTGNNQEIVLVSSETFTEDTDGTYYKLTNNTYTTEAPVEHDYMKETPGATSGYVVDEDYTDADKVEIGEVTYRPYKSETDSDKTVYILMKANVDSYTNTETKYKKEITFEQKNTNTEGVTATAEVGDDGVVIFNGLGAGEYTITETKTPNGYNTIAPITFTVEFVANPEENGNHWKTESKEAAYNPASGNFELVIVNNQGSTLPSTGGIGTTIFYVVGAILVIGAGVVLVTKRRMNQ